MGSDCCSSSKSQTQPSNVQPRKSEKKLKPPPPLESKSKKNPQEAPSTSKSTEKERTEAQPPLESNIQSKVPNNRRLPHKMLQYKVTISENIDRSDAYDIHITCKKHEFTVSAFVSDVCKVEINSGLILNPSFDNINDLQTPKEKIDFFENYLVMNSRLINTEPGYRSLLRIDSHWDAIQANLVSDNNNDDNSNKNNKNNKNNNLSPNVDDEDNHEDSFSPTPEPDLLKSTIERKMKKRLTDNAEFDLLGETGTSKKPFGDKSGINHKVVTWEDIQREKEENKNKNNNSNTEGN